MLAVVNVEVNWVISLEKLHGALQSEVYQMEIYGVILCVSTGDCWQIGGRLNSGKTIH